MWFLSFFLAFGNAKLHVLKPLDEFLQWVLHPVFPLLYSSGEKKGSTQESFAKSIRMWQRLTDSRSIYFTVRFVALIRYCWFFFWMNMLKYHLKVWFFQHDVCPEEERQLNVWSWWGVHILRPCRNCLVLKAITRVQAPSWVSASCVISVIFFILTWLG